MKHDYYDFLLFINYYYLFIIIRFYCSNIKETLFKNVNQGIIIFIIFINRRKIF